MKNDYRDGQRPEVLLERQVAIDGDEYVELVRCKRERLAVLKSRSSPSDGRS